MDNKIPEVSELLTKDFNDEIVIMQLMSYPRPELVIVGLIKLINKERAEYNKRIDEITKKIEQLNDKYQSISNNINMAKNMVEFITKDKNICKNDIETVEEYPDIKSDQ